ncbi:MAG: tetratricopeptide repeat protein [Chitinophagaceae bacterium]|nr:tetratricopeptide repeat protein [Rubrivivax sp.]
MNWNPNISYAPAAPAPAESLVIDVTEADFELRVLEQSLQVPVLLDCWAPWCGPCKSLGPVLEKLAREYDGRFILAKLNTDSAPQISAALQIRSIPLVVLFSGGRPVDQFTGALPEGQLRAFLDKHLPPLISEADAIRQEAAQADPETAEALLREALTYEPGHVEITLDLAERLVGRGALDDARALLGSQKADPPGDRQTALAKRIELARNRPQGDPQALAARIAANPKDFEARFALAALQAYEGDFNAAFDQLLEVVLRDKGALPENWREKARLQLVEWFGLCPDPAAVSRGRRYLGMYLN